VIQNLVVIPHDNGRRARHKGDRHDGAGPVDTKKELLLRHGVLLATDWRTEGCGAVTDVQLDELLSETWFMCVGLCCGDDNAEAQDHKVEIKEMPVEQQVREICSLAV